MPPAEPYPSHHLAHIRKGLLNVVGSFSFCDEFQLSHSAGFKATRREARHSAPYIPKISLDASNHSCCPAHGPCTDSSVSPNISLSPGYLPTRVCIFWGTGHKSHLHSCDSGGTTSPSSFLTNSPETAYFGWKKPSWSLWCFSLRDCPCSLLHTHLS